MRTTAIVFRSDYGTWIACIPLSQEIRGYGDTRDEAITNMMTAVLTVYSRHVPPFSEGSDLVEVDVPGLTVLSVMTR